MVSSARKPYQVGTKLFEGGVANVAAFGLLGVITAFVGRHQDLSLDPGTGCETGLWLSTVGDGWHRGQGLLRRRLRWWAGQLGRTVFVAEIVNFLAVRVENEQVGGRELLAVGQVDQVAGGAAVDAGEEGEQVGRGAAAGRLRAGPGQFSCSHRCGAVMLEMPPGSRPTVPV